jgi:hypothetical protein
MAFAEIPFLFFPPLFSGNRGVAGIPIFADVQLHLMCGRGAPGNGFQAYWWFWTTTIR